MVRQDERPASRRLVLAPGAANMEQPRSQQAARQVQVLIPEQLGEGSFGHEHMHQNVEYQNPNAERNTNDQSEKCLPRLARQASVIQISLDIVPSLDIRHS